MSDGDDVFSNNSLSKIDGSSMPPEYKNLIQTKGKLSMTFKAALKEEFVERV